MAIRVMIVDDAVVVRHVLKDALSKDAEIEVVGTAADGDLALASLDKFNPDIVILDIEMPNRNGIDTLPELKKRRPLTKVIMFSTLTARGASATLDALVAGADDYVTKPSNTGSMVGAVEKINEELIPKIKGLYAKQAARAANANAFRVAVAKPRPATGVAPGVRPIAQRPGSTAVPQILCIAVSTGGPNALAALIPQLPGDLAVPIVIVQHIPPVFSKALAERLDTKSALKVSEGVAGATIRPGEVWIAPGDFHMTVEKHGAAVTLGMNQGPQENSCRPAADVLFRSVAHAYGSAVLGLVLTGMGYDGRKGSQEIIDKGGHVIAQDEASSVVWGMPGAVADAGIAEEVLPLDKIAQAIVARVGTATQRPRPLVRP